MFPLFSHKIRVKPEIKSKLVSAKIKHIVPISCFHEAINSELNKYIRVV